MKSCNRDLGFKFGGPAAAGILLMQAATSISSSLSISRSHN